ncbi:hypothetical protein P12x_000944 [Tundrisphaera lichenicola]|uniref:hypothetical protein n=1 Tax=Tundrisphaera lichenicola TaxID=2029860 RepID=UPI003EB9933A
MKKSVKVREVRNHQVGSQPLGVRQGPKSRGASVGNWWPDLAMPKLYRAISRIAKELLKIFRGSGDSSDCAGYDDPS